MIITIIIIIITITIIITINYSITIITFLTILYPEKGWKSERDHATLPASHQSLPFLFLATLTSLRDARA